MSTEGALSELHNCSGTQFDPKVIAAFVKAIRAPLPAGSRC
jgi:response regulator RpfG family c-di-GMP phosphodiesterase